MALPYTPPFFSSRLRESYTAGCTQQFEAVTLGALDPASTSTGKVTFRKYDGPDPVTWSLTPTATGVVLAQEDPAPSTLLNVTTTLLTSAPGLAINDTGDESEGAGMAALKVPGGGLDVGANLLIGEELVSTGDGYSYQGWHPFIITNGTTIFEKRIDSDYAASSSVTTVNAFIPNMGPYFVYFVTVVINIAVGTSKIASYSFEFKYKSVNDVQSFSDITMYKRMYAGYSGITLYLLDSAEATVQGLKIVLGNMPTYTYLNAFITVLGHDYR